MSHQQIGATEQGTSQWSVTGHAITLNHVTDRDQAKVINTEKAAKWTGGSKKQCVLERSYQFSHTHEKLFAIERSNGRVVKIPGKLISREGNKFPGTRSGLNRVSILSAANR